MKSEVLQSSKQELRNKRIYFWENNDNKSFFIIYDMIFILLVSIWAIALPSKVLNITKILLRTTYIYLDSIYKYEGYGEESLTVYSVRHYN